MSKFGIYCCRTLCVMLFASLMGHMNAQSETTFADELQKDGQVSIYMPEELEQRLVANQETNSNSTSKTRTITTTVKKVSAKGQMMGYRIQAYIDNSAKAKQLASARARTIVSRFPQLTHKLEYRNPGWRLLVGEFASREDANRVISQLKSAFPSYAREFMLVKAQVYIK